MEDVITFRINQLRNFGRQSKRLKSRNITLGEKEKYLNIFFCNFCISVNKIEKSGDFIKSDEILRDVLFGARKLNITNETRSINDQ